MFQSAQTFSAGLIDDRQTVSGVVPTLRQSVTRWLTSVREPSTKDVLRRLDPHLLADIGITPEDLARD